MSVRHGEGPGKTPEESTLYAYGTGIPHNAGASGRPEFLHRLVRQARSAEAPRIAHPA